MLKIFKNQYKTKVTSYELLVTSALIILFSFNIASADVSAVKNFQNFKPAKLNSYSASVIDEATGKVLFSKRGDSEKPVASITKIVGAYVFLDTNPNLNKQAQMASSDEVGGGRLRLPIGTTLQEKYFLYSSLIGSANNSATALIRLSGIGKNSFIDKMNNFAENAGAQDTKFVDSCGISPSNHSTAKDLALIGRKVFSNSYICSISSKKDYSFPINNGKGTKTVTHTSPIVRQNNTFKIFAAKTGYLPEVGYNLIIKAGPKKGKGKVVVVTMGANTRAASTRDVTLLTNWALKNYKW